MTSPSPPHSPIFDTSSHPSPQPPLSQNPHFKPFFPLLTATTTTSATTSDRAVKASKRTYHPRTHYIFADDPPDASPITAAALHALSPASASPSTSPSPPSSDPSSEEAASNSTSPTSPTLTGGRAKRNKQQSSGAQRLKPRKKERYILLSLDETGTQVLSANSLSRSFAVTSTAVEPAPTWEGDGGQTHAGIQGQAKSADKVVVDSPPASEDKGLMLRIEGMEMGMKPGSGSRLEMGKGKGKTGDVGEDGRGAATPLEQLVKEYENGLSELRRVVDASNSNRLVGTEREGLEA